VARLKEITVDPKTVVLAKKIDAGSIGAPKPAMDLQTGTYNYQVKIEMGSQQMNMKLSTTVRDGAGSCRCVPILFLAIINLKMSVQGKKRDCFDLGANSRNTVRNAFCVIRGIFNDGIEANIIEVNPAVRHGRFTRAAKTVPKGCFE